MSSLYEPEHPEVDLFGHRLDLGLLSLPKPKHRIKKRPTIMGGPIHESCGTCAHLLTHQPSHRRFFKCALAWNHANSGASDIRKKHPACARWQAKPTTENEPNHP